MSDDKPSLPELPRSGLWLGTMLSLIAAGTLLASFGIQWLTVSRLGIGIQTDAFYAGATVQQVISTLVMDPLMFVLVPYFSALTRDERITFGWFLLVAVFLSAGLFSGVTAVFAPVIMAWVVPGFSPEAHSLAVELTRIQSLAVVGLSCFTVLACFCQAGKRFLWPALAALFCGVFGWALLWIGLDRWGVRYAAWIQVFILAGPAVILLPSLEARPLPSWADEVGKLRQLWSRFRPLVLSSAFIRSGFVVDRFLASFLDQGSLVILELAGRTLTALVRVLNQGITTPILPRLTLWAMNGQWEPHARLLRHRLAWIAGIGGLAFLLISFVPSVVLSEEIWARASATLGGALTPGDLRTLWVTFVCGSGILLFGGIHNLLINAFYTASETALPARIEMLTHTAGLAMKTVGVLLGGLMGIAIAISLFYALNTITLSVALRRAVGRRGVPDDSLSAPASRPSGGPPPVL